MQNKSTLLITNLCYIVEEPGFCEAELGKLNDTKVVFKFWIFNFGFSILNFVFSIIVFRILFVGFFIFILHFLFCIL